MMLASHSRPAFPEIVRNRLWSPTSLGSIRCRLPRLPGFAEANALPLARYMA
jgi:hypothetical protein